MNDDIVLFVSYLRNTGQIIGAGTTCAPETLVTATVDVLTGVTANPEHDYVSAGQVKSKGPRPSPVHQFDYAAGAWIDPRSLDELKASKWADIKAARAAAEYGGFWSDGLFYDSDEAASRRISGSVQLAQLALGAGQPFSVTWTLADNSTTTLSAPQMVAVGIALGQHVAAQYAHAAALRTQINAATTRAQLDTISWTT